MSEGVRITQAGSTQQRITQAGDRRITEHAVMASAAFSATIMGAPVAVQRRRSVSAVMTASPLVSAKVNGKVSASVAMTAAMDLAASVHARRGASVALHSSAMFAAAAGRTRTTCAIMHASTSAALVPQRQRPVFADFVVGNAVEVHVIKRAPVSVAMNAQTQMDDVSVQRQREVQMHLATGPDLAVGDKPPAFKRLTEEGETRHTQANDTRILEEDPVNDQIKRLRGLRANLKVKPTITFGQNDRGGRDSAHASGQYQNHRPRVREHFCTSPDFQDFCQARRTLARHKPVCPSYRAMESSSPHLYQGWRRLALRQNHPTERVKPWPT